MPKPSPKIRAEAPKSIWNKPVTVNLKDLFKALAKGLAHLATGKWEEIASDTVDTLSAIGLAAEPSELAALLIRRSLSYALFELIAESTSQLDSARAANQMKDQLDYEISYRDITIDGRFLDRPSNLPLIEDLQALLRHWLQTQGMAESAAGAIARRLPSYFVYALNQEWRRNAKSYRPLVEAIDTPFSKAGDREWAWDAYSALLRRRADEGIFDEPFGLAQMYIPSNAYYLEEPKRDSVSEIGKTLRRRVVVSLQRELEAWLDTPSPQDAIRVISGGPGSGKSSFARIFGAQVTKDPGLKVLYVPLHLIDPSKDLVDEVGRFARDEGVLLGNPLDPESPEPNLLVIFDGLDELASQGKAAAETARSFVREVEKTAEKRNLNKVRLRVLLSGRELVVQENESEFRRQRQVLTLLPYFLPPQHTGAPRDGEEYEDPDKLLKVDLRNQWWTKYGELTGLRYQGLPKDLAHRDFEEITAQPLLNYLIALSYTRGKLDFTKGANLNLVYADLVDAVHERGYEKHRRFGPVRHMKPDEFLRVLEEIGLAAWHGDGRSTTVREIEEHCRTSGLGKLLDVFQDGARAGVTRLLAAFFFRQYGARPSGDPTFVFTHKSFGEYLTARRIVRAMDRLVRELDRRAANPDEGWDEKEALRHWAQICGPSAMSKYLHTFLLNEVALRSKEDSAEWQNRLAKLLGYTIRHGLPMEQLQLGTFKEALFQSRNAEESLLVAMNACARVTGAVSHVEWPTRTAFGEWFKRLQGQRIGPEPSLAATCLSFLDLSQVIIHIGDFYAANLRASHLRGTDAQLASFGRADLESADLKNAILAQAAFEGANLNGANLERAHLPDADLQGANLQNAHINAASLQRADLDAANLEGANLELANLNGADLRGAVNLDRANLHGVSTKGARLPRGFQNPK
jgi:uncharacterized protein YjbI with pentapeptide repeats